jgi:hypothetical protein
MLMCLWSSNLAIFQDWFSFKEEELMRVRGSYYYYSGTEKITVAQIRRIQERWQASVEIPQGV